jgi:hypothetical protein
MELLVPTMAVAILFTLSPALPLAVLPFVAVPPVAAVWCISLSTLSPEKILTGPMTLSLLLY